MVLQTAYFNVQISHANGGHLEKMLHTAEAAVKHQTILSSTFNFFQTCKAINNDYFLTPNPYEKMAHKSF